MAIIKVYSQPTCPACNELKEYLKKKGVDFQDLDVTSDQKARDEMIKVHKVRVTPLIVYGDRKLIGFDPAEVDSFVAELK